MSRVVKENSSMQLQMQMRYRYHCGRCLWICAVWVSSWHFCGIGGIGGVYCLRVFYNQPHCCKGLKVCMNGRIFSCRRGNKQCENSWKKCGDSRIGETPWLKKWGLRPRGPIGVYAYGPHGSWRKVSDVIMFSEEVQVKLLVNLCLLWNGWLHNSRKQPKKHKY